MNGLYFTRIRNMKLPVEDHLRSLDIHQYLCNFGHRRNNRSYSHMRNLRSFQYMWLVRDKCLDYHIQEYLRIQIRLQQG